MPVTKGSIEEQTERSSASTSSQGSKEVIGYWGSRLKVTEEPEVITLTPPPSQHPQNSKGQGGGKKNLDATPQNNRNSSAVNGTSNGAKQKKGPSHNTTATRPAQGPPNTGDDQLLRKLKGKNGAPKKIAWRPGSGRHIDEGPDSYKPFTHIVRTLHLEDALQVLAKNRMEPKHIVTFSSLDSRYLPSTHPCANTKILWFSAKFSEEDEDEPNWYGNVEFAVGCNILLEMFKYCFLVEILTTPTHTTSRLLLTNKDYSAVLPHYYRERSGGPWQVTPEGHLALINCSRYRFQGINVFDHVLEFMLEVTPQNEKKILSECKISFKNHERAKDTTTPHVCNRHQRLNTPCPSPFSPTETATLFYQKLHQMSVDWNKVYAKLAKSAKRRLPKPEIGNRCLQNVSAPWSIGITPYHIGLTSPNQFAIFTPYCVLNR